MQLHLDHPSALQKVAAGYVNHVEMGRSLQELHSFETYCEIEVFNKFNMYTEKIHISVYLFISFNFLIILFIFQNMG